MAENKQKTVPTIKVSRQRRRLYEPLPEADENTTDGPAIATLTPEILPKESKEKSANKITMDFVKWSAGSALLPIPVLDMTAVVTLQLMMIKKLCELYEMEYAKQRVAAIVVSFTGGIHVGLIAGSLFKAVPWIGPTLAAASAVTISGAITYAVGKVFIKHFEAGGTLLDFDSTRMKGYFKKQFEKGRELTE
ncbi:MAG: DUF697 domain-containing protein [Proteobacteria bacterium]|nr:DUF697 domain-containing protein [Pseudomonadota bacterium]MBU1715001.1 DUF697 domain-containing protein [Pseudomonadota bacterium]